MCFIKLIKVHLLVSELYIYQNARCNDKNSKCKYFKPQNLYRSYFKCKA
jgi:hypothetical protein